MNKFKATGDVGAFNVVYTKVIQPEQFVNEKKDIKKKERKCSDIK